MQDEECPNCGELVEVEVWEEGDCPRCGTHYWWEELFDDEYETAGPIIMWE
jgi:hypothetical protein